MRCRSGWDRLAGLLLLNSRLNPTFFCVRPPTRGAGRARIPHSLLAKAANRLQGIRPSALKTASGAMHGEAVEEQMPTLPLFIYF